VFTDEEGSCAKASLVPVLLVNDLLQDVNHLLGVIGMLLLLWQGALPDPELTGRYSRSCCCGKVPYMIGDCFFRASVPEADERVEQSELSFKPRFTRGHVCGLL
jgi:hypothetical protein